jgi:hypothetical protein
MSTIAQYTCSNPPQPNQGISYIFNKTTKRAFTFAKNKQFSFKIENPSTTAPRHQEIYGLPQGLSFTSSGAIANYDSPIGTITGILNSGIYNFLIVSTGTTLGRKSSDIKPTRDVVCVTLYITPVTSGYSCSNLPPLDSPSVFTGGTKRTNRILTWGQNTNFSLQILNPTACYSEYQDVYGLPDGLIFSTRGKTNYESPIGELNGKLSAGTYNFIIISYGSIDEQRTRLTRDIICVTLHITPVPLQYNCNNLPPLEQASLYTGGTKTTTRAISWTNNSPFSIPIQSPTQTAPAYQDVYGLPNGLIFKSSGFNTFYAPNIGDLEGSIPPGTYNLLIVSYGYKDRIYKKPTRDILCITLYISPTQIPYTCNNLPPLSAASQFSGGVKTINRSISANRNSSFSIDIVSPTQTIPVYQDIYGLPNGLVFKTSGYNTFWNTSIGKIEGKLAAGTYNFMIISYGYKSRPDNNPTRDIICITLNVN